jgi:hemerythrin-like domain-containing protein
MDATSWLRRDHDLILDGLDALHAAATCVRAGGTLPPESTQPLVAFFREFADSYHHHKEEHGLFPALEEAGLPPQGPVGMMLYEHEQGRKFIKGMNDALPNLSVEDALEYVDLMRAHIDKENQVLFNIADRMLSPNTDRSLMTMFSEKADAMPQIVAPERHKKLFADVRTAAGKK